MSAGKFTQGVRDIVAQLLPFAQHSKTATSELSQLAQQAGGPATSNFQTLRAWVDKGHTSMGNLQSIINSTTQKMGNMAQVAQNLGAVVQSQIIQMMDSAKLKVYGVNQAVQAYTQSLKNNGAQSQVTHERYQHLVQVLTQVTGNQKEARNIADTYTRSLRSGTTAANRYAGSIDRLRIALHKLPHGETIRIMLHGAGKATFRVGTTGLVGMAEGGKLPGFGGGDRHLRLLESGEAVVDKYKTRQYSPVLKAMGVPGMAEGGIVGSFKGSPLGASRFMRGEEQRAVTLAATEIGKAMSSMATNLFAPITGGGGNQRAIRIGRQMAAGYGWTGGQFNALYDLWMRESSWNPYAVNPSSGAYGIPQSLGHGRPYALGDIPAQVAWGLNYIKSRYGSPMAAWGHETAFGWYDQGGYLQPGFTLAYNGTGAPEPVGRAAGGIGGEAVFDITVNLDGKQIYRNTRKHATRTQVRAGHTGLEKMRR